MGEAPRDTRSIYLVRAARTPISAAGRWAGRLDPPLDPEGASQAEASARTLGSAVVGAVFTSPLRRARATADAIGVAAGRTPEVIEELTDVDMGRWTGLTWAEAAARTPEEFARFFQLPQAGQIPDGSWMWETQRRLLDTLRTIGERTDGDVVAVTHELPIRLVLVKLRGLEGTALWDPRVAPGSIVRLRLVRGDLQIPSVLEDLLRASGDRPPQHADLERT